MTLEGLAERSGLHQNYLGEIERGQKNPSIETIAAIAGALEVSIGALLDAYDSESAAALKKRIRARLSGMTDTELIRVLRVLDAIRP